MRFDDRLAEIQEFLQFVAVDWASLRSQVADQLAKRCEHCILSEKYVTLQHGVCEICRNENREDASRAERHRNRPELERQLKEVLEAHSAKGDGNYDALLLFSGGKDSAFLLHRLRTEFPALRILAVTVDNGFVSHVALANCRRILERIDRVDHVVFKPEQNLYVKTFRHAFTNRSQDGCYATVDRMDGDLTFDIGRNLAASLQIPLLIAGLSPEQVERILELHTFESPAETERKGRSQSSGFQLDKIYDPWELKRYWWNGVNWPGNRIPRVIYPFYAWVYNEEFIVGEVDRLGLIDVAQSNPLITNNDTIPVMLAVDVCTLGYSSFEPEFAELVRSGKASRDQWLAVFESIEYLCLRGRFLPRCVGDTLRKLSLTHDDVGIPEPQDGTIVPVSPDATSRSDS